MHILFVYPIPSNYAFIDYHHGIAQLSALAKEQGHDTHLFMSDKFEKNRIDRVIQDLKPDIIAYSVTSDKKTLAQQYMDYLLPRKIFSVAGGIHSSIAPHDFIDKVDCVCRGEGDAVLNELIKETPLKDIKNLTYYDNNSIHTNPMRPFVQDLDALPFSDRELFDYQKSLDIDHRADFIAGRGCPYRCSYCVNNWLHKLASGKYVRLRSPENLLSEINSVLHHYKRIESLCFQDDTFTVNKKWIYNFCEKYKKQIKLPFVCNIRVETATKDMIETLKDAGCEEIRIGVEQGNEQMRRDVLKRHMSNQQFVDAVSMIKKAGIKVFVYNMIGIPGETEETINETIKLNQQLKPDKLHVSIFQPYPGTELYEQSIKNGYKISSVQGSFFQPIAAFDTLTLKKKQIEFYFRIFRVAVLFPALLPVAKMLARVKIGKRLTLYDVFFNTALRTVQFLQKHMNTKLRQFILKKFKV